MNLLVLLQVLATTLNQSTNTVWQQVGPYMVLNGLLSYRNTVDKPCGLHQAYLTVATSGEVVKAALYKSRSWQRLSAKKCRH